MNGQAGKRVLILSAGVGSGHNSAAKALEAAFREASGVSAIRMLDTLELGSRIYKTLFSDVYFALVEVAPWLVALFYDANDAPFKDANILNLWEQLNTSKLVETIREYQPEIVVCTHFLPAKLISLLLDRQEIQTHLAIITTDYDAQGLWLSSPFSRFFVAREETRAYMIAFGLPPDRVTFSGIPVNPEFTQPVEREAVLARYQLRPEAPILLISAGAAGSKFTHKIITQTLRMQNDFQAVVICGRNRKLKAEIEALVGANNPHYRVLGYTRDMANLMRVAALFVGKPGGLTSSECMAAGLPMVLVKPIPGQEVRNSDYLLEEGAAVRCNYDTTIGYKIDQLLGDSERLERMAAAARRVGRPRAAYEVAAEVLADASPHLVISRTAQTAILAAAEEGASARYTDDEGRVHTLIDAQTGRSAAVLTEGQLQALLPLAASAGDAATIHLSRQSIDALKQASLDADSISLLAQVLHTCPEVTLRVQDPMIAPPAA